VIVLPVFSLAFEQLVHPPCSSPWLGQRVFLFFPPHGNTPSFHLPLATTPPPLFFLLHIFVLVFGGEGLAFPPFLQRSYLVFIFFLEQLFFFFSLPQKSAFFFFCGVSFHSTLFPPNPVPSAAFSLFPLSTPMEVTHFPQFNQTFSAPGCPDPPLFLRI